MSVTNKAATQLDTLKESLKDVLASVVGSAACVYSGQPFDTVKVRMQVQPGEFKNSLECFRKTMVGEGITTLWRGSVPAFIGALSENAVAFCINGNLKRLLEGWLTLTRTSNTHIKSDINVYLLLNRNTVAHIISPVVPVLLTILTLT